MSYLFIFIINAGQDPQASYCQMSHISLISLSSRSTVFDAKPVWPDTTNGSQWRVLLFIESKCIIHTGMCVPIVMTWRGSLKERKSSNDYMGHMHIYVFLYKYLFLKAIFLVYWYSHETWNKSKLYMYWLSWNPSVYKIDIVLINNPYPSFSKFNWYEKCVIKFC